VKFSGRIRWTGIALNRPKIDGLEVLRRTWSRARGGGQADGALQHPGVHEGLR
jgi:hypothetical protein